MSHDKMIIRSHRPLRELTEDELSTLDTLGEHAKLFSPELSEHILALSLLASAELGERDLRTSLNSSKTS